MPDNELPPLRESLSAAFDKIEADNASEARDTAPVDRQVDEGTGADEAAQRARDEAGRFKATDTKEAGKPDAAGKPREKLTLKGKPDAAKEQERAQGQQPTAATGGAQRDNVGTDGAKPIADAAAQSIQPPAHWNGREKIEWDRLPHHVKETLSQEYQSVAELRALNPVLEPLKQRFAQEFGGTDRALTSILSTWQFARQNPVDFTRQFMQQFGIDPRQLGAASGQSQVQHEEPASPQYVTHEEAAAIYRRSQAEAQQAAIAQQINSDVSSLQADPSLPYFNDLRATMAGLITSVPDLVQMTNRGQGREAIKKAYEMAQWSHPEIRQQILSEQQNKDQAERKRAASTAKNAAVSVNGAPGIARPSQPQGKTSVAESLSRAYDAVVGGSRA